MSSHHGSQSLAPPPLPMGLVPPSTYIIPLVVTAVVALTVSLVLPHFGFANKWGGTGHDGYLELAANLYAGNGFRFTADGPLVFHRPPLYPALLVPAMGFDVTVQKIYVALLNSVFFTAACLYTVRTTRLLYLHPSAGMVAVILLMANPWLYRLVSSPLSALMQMSLYAALTFYVLRFLIQYDRIKVLPLHRLAGQFARLSVLTTALCYAHGTSIYVCSVLLFFTLTLTIATQRWRLVLMTLLLALVTITALSPWASRNEQLLGRAEPVTSGAGYTYFLGNIYWDIDNDANHGNPGRDEVVLRQGGIAEPSEDMIAFWGVIDPAVDATLREAMIAHIKAHPVEIAKKSLLNFSDIFFPITHVAWCAAGGISSYCVETLSPYQTATRAVRTVYMAILIGFALFSVFAGSQAAWWLPGFALLTAGLYSLPYFPIATYAHHGIYSLGALPLLSVLAAAAMVRLFTRNRDVTVRL